MRNTMYLILLLILLSLISCSKNDADQKTAFEKASSLDDKIDSLVTASNLPGVVVRVVASDNREYTKSSGVCNIQTNSPRILSDPFRIASITKTFTASVIHVLVSEGEIINRPKARRVFSRLSQCREYYHQKPVKNEKWNCRLR